MQPKLCPMKDRKHKYMVLFSSGTSALIKTKSFSCKEIFYIYALKIFFLNVRYRPFIMYEYNLIKEAVLKYVKVNVGSPANEKPRLSKM